MHLNKSTTENDPETTTNCTTETSRKITSRVQFIFCNYVFSYIKIDLQSESVGANQLDPVRPSPCLLKGSLVKLLLRPLSMSFSCLDSLVPGSN